MRMSQLMVQALPEAALKTGLAQVPHLSSAAVAKLGRLKVCVNL
jgi:hypothetical protein